MRRVSTSCDSGSGRHPKDRLVGKENGALRHLVDIAAEPKSGEVIEKLLAETRTACQLLDFLRREPQVLQEVERRLESGRHQESASRRQLANEELEHGGFCVAMLKVGLEHVELIEVGEQRAGFGIHRMPGGAFQFDHREALLVLWTHFYTDRPVIAE